MRRLDGPNWRVRGLSPSPRLVDAGLAVVFISATVIERLAGEPLPPWRLAIAALAALGVAANLAVRRRLPLAGFLVGTVALLIQPILDVPSAVAPYANQICLYSLGAYATRARAWWGPPVVLISVPLYFAASDSATFEPAGVLFVWLVTWWLGYGTARRREDQERARQAVRAQVLAEERARTARELHDVIGHTVNVLVVQAGAARLTLEHDRSTARDLLLAMEQTGRDALGELDQVLGTMRQEPAPLETAGNSAPTAAPGLAQIPDLVSRLVGSGVDVRLRIDPQLRLPHNLDLSAYRIVQEGLTNALKHAAPCSADVVVRRDGASVVVEVCDDGTGADPRDIGGRGLLGLAERVAMHGGAMEHGRRSCGGFRLRAVLPLT